MTAMNLLVFAVLPYAAALLCVIAAAERYRRHGYSYTSLSSQFLENRMHFWALVPFHIGILVLLAGHLIAFLVPRGVLAWNEVPARLLILEATALAAGLLALGGLATAVMRRATVPPVRATTKPLDWVVYALLLAELTTGIALALRYTWGSSWFAVAASPYLWSIVTLQPDASLAATMPPLVRLHIGLAWLLLAVFPFSRLVHILVVPNHYLWRPPQVVRWYRRPATALGRKP